MKLKSLILNLFLIPIVFLGFQLPTKLETKNNDQINQLLQAESHFTNPSNFAAFYDVDVTEKFWLRNNENGLYLSSDNSLTPGQGRQSANVVWVEEAQKGEGFTFQSHPSYQNTTILVNQYGYYLYIDGNVPLGDPYELKISSTRPTMNQAYTFFYNEYGQITKALSSDLDDQLLNLSRLVNSPLGSNAIIETLAGTGTPSKFNVDFAPGVFTKPIWVENYSQTINGFDIELTLDFDLDLMPGWNFPNKQIESNVVSIEGINDSVSSNPFDITEIPPTPATPFNQVFDLTGFEEGEYNIYIQPNTLLIPSANKFLLSQISISGTGIEIPQGYGQVTSLTQANLTSTSIDFIFNFQADNGVAGLSAYAISTTPTTSPFLNWIQISANNGINTINVTGLTQNTLYFFYISSSPIVSIATPKYFDIFKTLPTTPTGYIQATSLTYTTSQIDGKEYMNFIFNYISPNNSDGIAYYRFYALNASFLTPPSFSTQEITPGENTITVEIVESDVDYIFDITTNPDSNTGYVISFEFGFAPPDTSTSDSTTNTIFIIIGAVAGGTILLMVLYYFFRRKA